MGKVAYEKQELEKLCKESFCYNEILTKTGRVKGGKNIAILKKYIELYNIDISHFTNSTNPNKNAQQLSAIKICQQCGKEKDTYNDYYWSNGHTRNICKECVRENERKRYKERTIEIEEFKKTLECKKCGESRFYLLDFHHRNPNEKDFTIADRSRTNLAELQKEIDKCDVLCSNCHREWHYLQQHDKNLKYEEWLAE